jgi:RNA polymerase sigma-70 factor (ECF subfamily)
MSDVQIASDLELLEAWRRGDQLASAALFERHYASVARFFRNKVSDAAQDDLVHETFLGCLHGLVRFRGQASFRTFLFGVAHRVLADYVRRMFRRNARHDGEVDIERLTAASQGLGPVSKLVRKEEQRLVLEGLRRIPLTHQIALELHYWEGLTAVEIGEVLGVPAGTAKTRIRDGRHYLEEELRRLGRSPEVLRSTLDDLDQWARRMREQREPAAPADSLASQAPR